MFEQCIYLRGLEGVLSAVEPARREPPKNTASPEHSLARGMAETCTAREAAP